ncbi:MAG: large conductance mechanosensitive channel [Actinomycetota bacterium]|jgi:large conductance mechanosensitive channel|nr:large conductance mechanosensitive channel [Actinomycetota bacterium]
MIKDFKAFLFRGNLLDLATAVVLGVAFNAVVQSLVKDLLTPLIAAAGGKPDFGSLTLGIGKGVIHYGLFLNALFNFVVIAAVIFLLLRAATRAQKLRASSDAPDEDTPPPSDEVLLLSEIRDLLRNQRA